MKGLLGKQELVANSTTQVYQVSPKAAYAEIDINILNPTVTDAIISLAISNEAVTPNPEDFIEKGLKLTGDGSVLLRSKEVLSGDERIYVRSDTAGVIVRVSGIERI